MIRVNDESAEYQPGMSVADLLKKQGMGSAMVAVWVNGEFIPRGRYEDTILPDESSIQIVLIVAGG